MVSFGKTVPVRKSLLPLYWVGIDKKVVISSETGFSEKMNGK